MKHLQIFLRLFKSDDPESSSLCWVLDRRCLVFRSVSPAGRISSTSPIRSVKSPLLTRKTQTSAMALGPEVPPPWKQEGYVASTEAEMRETMLTSSTQIRTEERWEGRYGVQEQMTTSGATFAAGAVATGATEVLSELLCFVFLPFTFCSFQPGSCHEAQSVEAVHMSIRI